MDKRTMEAALKLVERALHNGAEDWQNLPRVPGKQKPTLADYLYKNVSGAVGQNKKYVVCCCHEPHRPGSTKLVVIINGKELSYHVWLQERPREIPVVPVTKEAGPSSKHYGSGLTDGGHYDMVTHLNRIDNQVAVAVSERGFRRWENNE
jgi:hypothetical protein